MTRRSQAATALAAGGVLLIGLGFYFLFLRPPLLPEDLRFIGTSASAAQGALPGLSAWLRRVFWVMGGYILTTGVLTTYLALTAFRSRAHWVGGIVAIAGLTSIGWMAIVNFLLGSDFRWLLLAFALPWILALGLHWSERAGPLREERGGTGVGDRRRAPPPATSSGDRAGWALRPGAEDRDEDLRLR